MSFFDAPWHIIILAVVVLVLFGSSRLPGAARALGSSMHIFKKSLKEGQAGDQPSGGTFNQPTMLPRPEPSPQQLPTQPADAAHQAQIDDLQKQIQDLQRTSTGGAAGTAPAQDPQRNQQSY